MTVKFDGLTMNQLAERNAELVAKNEELQRKVAALTAENAAFKKFGDTLYEMKRGLDGTGVGIQSGYEVECQKIGIEAAMDAFDEIDTPATDAALADVRGQARTEGVDGLSKFLYQRANKLVCEGSKKKEVIIIRTAARLADDYAQQLRKESGND